ncbi:UNVERIFIED_CONTAM: G-patch domain-containing protein 1 [Sesamum angustifolium]|uniref:G-patch domain-containing protein 1 n=1 Tax=Sesamum angustifolium TaxID=2727405 RepID=A0AAW2INW5_9LAMI
MALISSTESCGAQIYFITNSLALSFLGIIQYEAMSHARLDPENSQVLILDSEVKRKFKMFPPSGGDTNLGLSLEDKATSGKQGLGIKDRPKKVAGCYFEGKKTTFGDSDGEDSFDSRSSVKRKHHDTSDMDEGGEKPKLKKLCRQLLRQAPGESLKLKQLKELVDELSPSTFSNFSSKEALTFLKHKLENSDRFSVKGKKVSIVERS